MVDLEAPIKLNKDPAAPPFREDASMEELRARDAEASGDIGPGARSGSVGRPQ
jgi:hypothetical protein